MPACLVQLGCKLRAAQAVAFPDCNLQGSQLGVSGTLGTCSSAEQIVHELMRAHLWAAAHNLAMPSLHSIMARADHEFDS